MPISNLNSSKKSYMVEGIYQGAEERLYLFKDDLDESLEFDLCDENVLKNFDLTSSKEIDQHFTITYVSNKDDEHDEAELEIIKLVRSVPLF